MSGFRSAYSAVCFLVLALVLFGCGAKSYPPELMQAKAALADAKAEGATGTCPEEYSSAEAMLLKAEALWQEGESMEMQVTAAEAEKLANTAKECVITKTSSVSANVSPTTGALPQELAGYTVSVYFNYNDNSITPQEAKKLREAADFLKKSQEGTKFWIILTAQCDSPGAPAANLELSRRRGLVTRYFLMDQGVAVERILIKPLGATQIAVDKESKKKKKADPESRKVVLTLEPFKLLEGYRVGDPFLRDIHAMGNTNP